MPASDPAAELHVGPDLVRLENGFVVIYSPRDMDGWCLREFCRPIIWFQEQKLFLRAKESVRGTRRWKYSLDRWPEDDHHPAPFSITYSAEFVAVREAAFHSQQTRTTAGQLLLPLSPLLGFLWSRTKRRLEPLGLNSEEISSLSVALEFGAFMVFGIFIGYLGFWSVETVLLWLGIGLDVMMRYDSQLRQDGRCLGFLEWCWPRR